MTHINLPLDFRTDEIQQIFSYLNAGESCQLIGTDGSGKSNLMQFLTHSDVLRHYLGSNYEQFMVVYLNANLLLEGNDWGLYELMLHELVKQFEARKTPERILQTVDELHRRASEKNTMHLALRFLDRALSLSSQIGCEVVVFLLDEFDHIVRELSPACFSVLRGLRDEYKYKMMFITSSDRPLNELREDSSEFESFYELISGHHVWLMAYSLADAQRMIERVCARVKVSLNAPEVERILTLSGRHPGLIMTAINTTRRGLPLDEAVLVRDAIVKEECNRLWRSLPVSEQRILLELTGNHPIEPDKATFERLKEKGLLVIRSTTENQTGDHISTENIFSPLFSRFLIEDRPVAGALIEIDHKRREVWVQGKRIIDLTPQEFSCLDFLDQHRGEVCRPDAIARYFQDSIKLSAFNKPLEEGKDNSYKTSVDAMIKRLRKKIEPDPEKPRFIQTVRGIGYKLVDGTD